MPAPGTEHSMKNDEDQDRAAANELLNSAMDYARRVLKRYGEIGPFAFSMNDDGSVSRDGVAVEQMGERGVGGVEGGEEVGGHGSAVGGEGLVFNGADFDDAGVVDEDVDAAVVVDGTLDERGGLGGVGEVAGDEEDVLGGVDGFALEEGLAGAL